MQKLGFALSVIFLGSFIRIISFFGFLRKHFCLSCAHDLQLIREPIQAFFGIIKFCPCMHQMGPKDLLSMTIRRRWVIVCVALPIIVLSAFATFRSAEKLTASTRVMVEGKEPETPNFDHLATNWDVVLSTAAQIAMSKPVAEKTADILFDVDTPEDLLAMTDATTRRRRLVARGDLNE